MHVIKSHLTTETSYNQHEHGDKNRSHFFVRRMLSQELTMSKENQHQPPTPNPFRWGNSYEEITLLNQATLEGSEPKTPLKYLKIRRSKVDLVALLNEAIEIGEAFHMKNEPSSKDHS